jgi:hypothetical protein
MLLIAVVSPSAPATSVTTCVWLLLLVAGGTGPMDDT